MKALEQYQSHRINLEKELKKFIDGMKTPSIKALASKIEHICENLGSPLSVTEMLKSICNNTIKKWGGERGKKKIGIASKEEAFKENKQNPNIVCGHFRWDYGKAYLLTDKEINYIKSFYFTGEDTQPSFDLKSEYHVNAVKFIKKHNVVFKIKLLKKGKYFNNDDKERNIYEITLSRKNHTFIFTFGQSIIATQNGETPSVYDVLVCLTKYNPSTFEDFCSEFGYDTDSEKAEPDYNAVVNEWNNVKALFTDAEIEELAEIQ